MVAISIQNLVWELHVYGMSVPSSLFVFISLSIPVLASHECLFKDKI
jgi:hypothetical protein